MLEKIGAIQEITMNFAKAESLNEKNPFKRKPESVFIGHDGIDSITLSIKNNLKNIEKFFFDCRVS